VTVTSKVTVAYIKELYKSTDVPVKTSTIEQGSGGSKPEFQEDHLSLISLVEISDAAG
jgi:hypothetical protein